MKTPVLRPFAALVLLVVAGCSSAPTPSRDFIPKSELPDPLLFVPPPPAADSATKTWDLAQHALATKLRANPVRAAQAARDAVFTWENLFETFAPAYGRTISETETPALCAMLKFGLNTTRNSYRTLKRTYRRERPFAELNEPPLRPEDAKHLGPDSYPSGHSATAWAAALLLSEVRPAAAEAILDRGRVAGESRLVCGVHWASDVKTGRLIAGVAVSRLHVDPDFRALLDAALREEAALPPPPAPPADPFAAQLPDAVAPGDTITLPFFGAVTVVDAVDAAAATADDHRFEDFPAGASAATNLLGRACRTLAVQEKGSAVLKWRLGEGRGVKPNGAYVVVVEYPDDLPRDYLIRNNANNSRRSFYTGAAIGDAWAARYVDHHPESLKIPQSGEWRLWTALTFPGEKASTRAEDGTTDIATEGFDFMLVQYPKAHHPESAGLAVGRVLLCEIPDETALWAPIVYPPAPLPRRRIFWREEMSDGAMGNICPGNDGLDWLEQKMRAMKMLGQNTFCKDLLEFGHNQHWDPHWRTNADGSYPAGEKPWMWKSQGATWDVWSRAVPLAADKYGFEILPYYEYGGAAGPWERSLGYQKRPEPLDPDNKPDRETRGSNYTHIWWSEGKLRVDVTDPDTLVELKYILDGTILRFTNQVARGGFAGAWFRPRPGQWAVSFSDATRARFAAEANGGAAVSREDLKADKALYDRYIDWWGGRRAAFLEDIRAYLETNGVAGAIALLDNDASEGGPGLAGRGGLVTDDPATWEKLLPGKAVDVRDPDILADHLYRKAITSPAGTWGEWEWQHACPASDPAHYAALTNVWISMAFHRLFTVDDPAAFDAFRNGNGTDTIIRHYGLNENMVEDAERKRLIGYAIADFERAGRACMMAEVNAMANGDPVNLGYLMGSNFTRGFPGPVQEFNRNFLALPALPSERLVYACADADTVLRRIDAGEAGDYYALVHTGWNAKANVRVRFPEGVARLVAPATGETFLPGPDGVFTFALQPWQLLALRAEPQQPPAAP